MKAMKYVRILTATFLLASVLMASFCSTVAQMKGSEHPLKMNYAFSNPILTNPLLGTTQYVLKNGSSLKIAHKYNSGNDMWIMFDHAGANHLYGMKEWRLSPNANKDTNADLARPSVILWPYIGLDWTVHRWCQPEWQWKGSGFHWRQS
ncbi:hypothetical protein M5X06_17385 [Paenibacillus alvei]|uniref:Uncharacterized protein n=1 Tax=Paenibacillus alvei TaxID=44250 RepID=A0ABT4GZ97_PAEAL|nr:hypothetical protein [Paenibacillus alvei]MCY9762003.1 hypothetical protein [Paenibacillus alvei]MCY9768579.1 hypothetical protein [Paenibacillus alvei]